VNDVLTNNAKIPRATRMAEDGSMEVAVLVSPGFGAGWSTWNQEFSELFLFHKKLVELVLRGNVSEEILCQAVSELTEGEYIYTGGAEDLEVEWIPEGAKFWMHEYDGSESMRQLENFVWATA